MATRFSYLFRQYYEAKATATEVQELRTLLDQGEHEAELQELMKEYWQQTPNDAVFFDAAISERMLRQILPAATKVRRLHWIRKVAAAAAILIFIAGGYYFYEQSRKEEAGTTTLAKQDIAPGHAGAILTLSNGKKIVLDSATNGAVAMDGSIQIVKENGQIKYVGADGKVIFNKIQTDKGRSWSVELPDGSKVWLNASSSIHYPLSFTGKERLVQITGECYFEVKHDDKMPFRVELPNGMIVEDVGTAFNIKAYSDEAVINTTVIEGEVNVISNNKNVYLKAGQQAHVSNGNIVTMTANNVDEIIAWKDNRFRFRSASLKQIFKETARWYDMEVVYQDNVPDTYTFSVSRDVPLSKLLESIEQCGGVHLKIEGKQVIVTK